MPQYIKHILFIPIMLKAKQSGHKILGITGPGGEKELTDSHQLTVVVPRLVTGCILLHYLAIAILSVLDNVMNTAQLESITNAAMTLSERERAKLACDLVASLDTHADVSVAEAWDAEVCRRINDIKSGKTELLGADEAIACARARIRN